MKIEAQLVELTAWRGELANILLAIAVVILVCVVASVIQDLRRVRQSRSRDRSNQDCGG
jgi:hypothetical protein